jgi:hypothetical protein
MVLLTSDVAGVSANASRLLEEMKAGGGSSRGGNPYG